MTSVMYDSVTVGEIPTAADAVALYIDGLYDNWRQGLDHTPHARRLSIAVTAAHDADALDIENGDATPDQAPGWVRRQQQRNRGTRPVLYSSRDAMPAVIAELRRNGITRDQVRLWSAHYGQGPHLCSPRSCGAAFTADATQWTDRALGRNLDESLLADGFWPAPQPKKKRVIRPHKKVAAGGLAAAIATGILAAAHAAHVALTPAESSAIATVAGILAGYLAPPGYVTRRQ